MPVLSTRPSFLNKPDDDFVGPIDPREQNTIDTEYYKAHENDPMWKRIALDLPNILPEAAKGFIGIDPNPNNRNKPSYWANATTQMVQAADPLVKGAVLASKGAAIASPLVTLYKDAQGIPSQTIRAEQTAKLLEHVKNNFGGNIQAAVEWFAKRWPRLAAHFNLPNEHLTNSPGTLAAMVQPPDVVRQGLNRDVLFTKMGERVAQADPAQARALITEEGGSHTAQNLMRADQMKTEYRPATKQVGYENNPYEIAVKGRAEQSALGDYRAKSRLSRDNTPFNIDEGMANIKEGKTPYAARQEINPLDDNEVTKQFKEMMYKRYGKTYPNTIYDKNGKVVSQVNAPPRAPRNRVRPPRMDFKATVTPD
jgi:hypothetical protein